MNSIPALRFGAVKLVSTQKVDYRGRKDLYTVAVSGEDKASVADLTRENHGQTHIQLEFHPQEGRLKLQQFPDSILPPQLAALIETTLKAQDDSRQMLQLRHAMATEAAYQLSQADHVGLKQAWAHLRASLANQIHPAKR